MNITFHGAAQTVTGSKHLLQLPSGKKLLLDCGMFQGMGKDTMPLNQDFGFDPSKVDYMILSHAHIDHSGLLPKLVKDGYAGQIYATPATRDLTRVLLEDSATIQQMDVEHENKRRSLLGLPYVKPLYTKDDALAASDRMQEVDYGKWVSLDGQVSFCFTDVGHIIGSAAVHLRIQTKDKTVTLTFSGDVGRYRDMILRSPEIFPQADYIILESTYGNSLHDQFHPSTEVLLEAIQHTCIKKKGVLIIPAFSVGRTQEILYTLNQLELENRLPDLDYFLDSPLSSKATSIVKSYPSYFNPRIQKVLEHDEDPFAFKGLKMIKSVDESKMLNFKKGPMVIISASGMAEAGRVKHHISNHIENSKNTVLLTGYCEPNSLGGRLIKKPEEVTIFGKPHQVNAEILQMRSMSAHGDYEDLCQFLSCQDKEMVSKLFLVHGEPEVQAAFRDRLLKKGFRDVVIPKMHEQIGL
jgi:metallo-beta-lactamase family protein